MLWIITALQTFPLATACFIGIPTFWEEWWAYEGISGPDFWGTQSGGDWALCSKGKFQSPIDIHPRSLIYDPNLSPLQVDSNRVNGILINTGHDITYHVSDESRFSFSGGPLSYTYRAHSIKLHFGINNDRGSEHTVAGRQFPLEVQILAYNEELYHNCTSALTSTHGLAIISILGIIDDTKNDEFDRIIEAAKSIRTKGLINEIRHFSIASVIPPTDYYMTYEGSVTRPSCQETVTWVLVNKPLHITKDQMDTLRKLNRLNLSEDGSRTPLMENNYRPPMPLHRRPIRTNISPYKENEDCAVKTYTYYKVNERLIGV